MATILITHGIPTAGLEALQGHNLMMPEPLSAYTMQELKNLIPLADAVIAGGKLPGDVIRVGKRLRIIANYGAGHGGRDFAPLSSDGGDAQSAGCCSFCSDEAGGDFD